MRGRGSSGGCGIATLLREGCFASFYDAMVIAHGESRSSAFY
jgi:hypothetical protein